MPRVTKTMTQGGLNILMKQIKMKKYGFKNPVLTVTEITKSEALCYPTKYLSSHKMARNETFYRVTLEYET